MRSILIAVILLLTLEADALAESANDCPRIQRSAAEAMTSGLNLAGKDDPKRLLDALRQELSRRTLTRAQIKKCDPILDRLLGKLEKCAASGDRECRFSKQEADEINKLPGVADNSEDCPSIIRRAFEATAVAGTVAGTNPKILLERLDQEFSRRNLTRARVKECAPAIDSMIAKVEQCAASGVTKCEFSPQEANEISKLNVRSTIIMYEDSLRQPHSWLDCHQGRAFGEPTEIPPTIDLETAITAFGNQKVYELISLATNWLSSCTLLPSDPVSWSERRLRAMVIIEAALRINAIGTDASLDCDSLVNFRNCALWVKYRLENLTDMTFTSVAVGCLAQLSTPRGTFQLANVQYDPIVGNPLGPGEFQEFSLWYGVSHLGMKFNSAQVTKGGSSKWCHVLAARANPVPNLTKEMQKQKN